MASPWEKRVREKKERTFCLKYVFFFLVLFSFFCVAWGFCLSFSAQFSVFSLTVIILLRPFYVGVISIFIDRWFWAYAVLAERSLFSLELPISCSDYFLGSCAVVGLFALRSMNAVWFWSVFLKNGFGTPSLINTMSCFFLLSQHCSKCKTEKNIFDADSDSLSCAL